MQIGEMRAAPRPAITEGEAKQRASEFPSAESARLIKLVVVRWVGAQIGLMSLAAEGAQDHQSFIDVDYFRVGQ